MAADLFVFPSATDTFGNVVLEAQASGLPVVVSDQGGPKELMKDGETGAAVRTSSRWRTAAGCQDSRLLPSLFHIGAPHRSSTWKGRLCPRSRIRRGPLPDREHAVQYMIIITLQVILVGNARKVSFVLLLSYKWSTSTVDKCPAVVDKIQKCDALTSLLANCILYRQGM